MALPQRPAKAAIVGPGNIGTDLMFKLLRRSEWITPAYMIGVDPTSDGLRRAERIGLQSSAEGVDWLLKQDDLPDIVFECTSAKAHAANAPRYEEAGIVAVDLTPAAIGPFCSPPVNLDINLDAMNLNMITCGGQATIPVVAAIHQVTGDVPYAEIVASLSSRSAGPGTRANIDEFTETTSRAIEVVGGARKGKAIIILNPVEPPMKMRNTVFAAIPAEYAEPGAAQDRLTESIMTMRDRVREYVPGYDFKAEPQYDPARPTWNGMTRVAVFVEVVGRGDYLPDYAGNLDIITAGAARIGDVLMAHRLGGQASAANAGAQWDEADDTTLTSGALA
ncbi:acetaldehyde dehydrogenase (acetylating) [Mobilicoccus caccae]|uniref:Acetaldehyde dehydrogenase n=1 Tax=Mobilicoccus caccae TaxID=1859295 RepID=A0ABQ6IWA8_9MICO|nr:acetaldehyde dehydrogenase (acetylating) [Mobilicoccus caccae]GMA42230.1 acetaldehyde dehydrogenase [Mobilicoccus caccae]